MIVSRIKLKFEGSSWTNIGKPAQYMRQPFEQLAEATATRPKQSVVEKMSLGELLYHALMTEGTPA